MAPEKQAAETSVAAAAARYCRRLRRCRRLGEEACDWGRQRKPGSGRSEQARALLEAGRPEARRQLAYGPHGTPLVAEAPWARGLWIRGVGASLLVMPCTWVSHPTGGTR